MLAASGKHVFAIFNERFQVAIRIMILFLRVARPVCSRLAGLRQQQEAAQSAPDFQEQEGLYTHFNL